MSLSYHRLPVTDVDLTGDGGGDEGGAAFLQQVNGALGFGGEGVELFREFCDPADDHPLLC